jgi:hypothetical protein
MKKTMMFFFLIMTFLAFVPSESLEAAEEPSEISITSESLLKYPEYNTVNVLSYAGGNMLYSSTDIIGNAKVVYVVNKEPVLELRMNPTAFFESGDAFYLGGQKSGKNVLLRVRKLNRQVTEKVLDDTTRICAGLSGQDGIIVAGSKGNDGYVAKLDSNMEAVSEKTYGGDGYETYDSIQRVGDIYLLSGVKDACSQGMANVGNLGETKAFLSFLNDDFTLIRHEYLNFHTPAENVSRILSDVEGTTLLIRTDNDFHVCRLMPDFSFVYSTPVSSLSGMNPDKVSLEKGNEGTILLVVEERSKIGFGALKEKTGERQFFSILPLSGQLKRAEASGGFLQLFSCINNELILHRVDHYEKTEIGFTCAKDHCPMEEIDEIGIRSYLGEVKVSRLSISPYFSNNLSGTYEAVYEVRLPSGRVLNCAKTIKVMPYVNVIDGGIYPVNYVLDFFDNGRLNGVSVTRNKKLTTPGDYVLVLKNNIGESKTLFFKVAEDYYKDGVDNIQPADYVVSKNQELKIRLPFTTAYDMEELIISGNPRNDFTYREGMLEFTVLPPSEEGLYYYEVQEIHQIFQGMKITSRINQVFSVLVLKEEPRIEVEKIPDKLEFKVLFTDPDGTITDIGVNVYEDDVFKTSYYAALKDMELKPDNLTPNRSYRLEYFISYHLGQGILHKKTILDCRSEIYVPRLDLGKIAITRQNQVLEEIRITLNNSENEMDILKIISGGKSAALPSGKNHYYQGLALGSTMIVLSVGAAIVIRRIRRKPKTK